MKPYIWSIFLATVALCFYCVALAAEPAPELVISSPTQPKEGLALPGALRVPFTRVTFSARGTDIAITSFTVRQSGAADDAVFEEILLLDENEEELGETRLKESEALFAETLHIPRNTSKTITIAGNMAEELDEFEGHRPTLSLIAITAEGYVVPQ